MDTTLPELPTRHEVAAFLRVGDATVDRLIRQGKIKAVKFGATVRILRPSVEAFLTDNTSAEPLVARGGKKKVTAPAAA